MSSIEACVAQAATVAALRVEWVVIGQGTGLAFSSQAFAMQAFNHHPMVEKDTFRPMADS